MQHGDLQWKNSHTPFSSQFDDVYYSAENGLAESRYVFLQSNRIPQRWQGQNFVIGETGFGTGLNFLCTWQEWRKHHKGSEQLHFITTEKFPLSQQDLKAALAHWDELAPLAEQLIEQWPRPWPGFHRLHFADGVTLDLLLGDAGEMLHTMNARVDAWYLDGFAPSKNPDMWQPELFSAIQKLSYSNTTLATFTCAGLVKRGLKEAGFTLEKIPGFGRKREMLTAQFIEQETAVTNQSESQPVIIVGAGLAGCHLARRLADNGKQVVLIEQNQTPGMGASCNPAGLLKPLLHLQSSNREIFHNLGYFYSLRRIQQLAKTTDQPIWDPCGIIEQPGKHSDERLLQMLEKRPILQQVAKPVKDQSSYQLLLDQSGICAPAKICGLLIDHPKIQLKNRCKISRLENSDSGWKLYSEQQLIASAEQVIFCPGHLHQLPEQFDHLLTRPLQGQVTKITTEEEISHPAICGKSYIAKLPGVKNQYCIGATFNRGKLNTAIDPQQDQQNIEALRQLLPEQFESLEAQVESATSGIRATVPDYTPIAGEINNGLWINTGHGARGLVTAPLVAEILASQLCDFPWPANLAAIIDPERKAAQKKTE